MENNSKFFRNVDCEYFPCHKVGQEEYFNCLFCYCPLYVLGEQCGGGFTYTDQGVKDCSACPVPHAKDAADYIASRWEEIAARVAINHREEEK